MEDHGTVQVSQDLGLTLTISKIHIFPKFERNFELVILINFFALSDFYAFLPVCIYASKKRIMDQSC